MLETRIIANAFSVFSLLYTDYMLLNSNYHHLIISRRSLNLVTYNYTYENN
jgi:hypothetical protein